MLRTRKDNKLVFKNEGKLVLKISSLKIKFIPTLCFSGANFWKKMRWMSMNELSIGDWYLNLLVTKQKPYYYLQEHFALYRVHNQGIFSKKSNFYKSFQKVRLLYIFLQKEGNNRNSNLIRKSLAFHIFGALKASGKENKKEIKELYTILLTEKIYKINRSVVRSAINLIK